MALKVGKAELWSVAIADRPGGAADMIEPLANAGASFEFVHVRRTDPGKGLAFVAPVKGAKVVKVAKAVGFDKWTVPAVRIEGPDKPGVAAKIMRALGNAGISFRGMSVNAVSRKFVCYVGFDNVADAAKAASVLKRLG